MRPELSILAAPLVAALPSGSSASQKRQADASIHDAFVNAGKAFFGTATDQGLLQTDPNAAIIQANFGQVTAENSMKWGSLSPSEGQYNWDGADFLADWATENDKLIRGHTLVWHSQLPSWVEAITDAEQLRGVIREHVTTTVGRYKGRIAHWDVVNEIFDESGELRDSVFSQLLGDEFVQIAFEAAREADPDAALYINDYNLDQANYAKVNGMVSNVQKWVDAGVPIDGIGTQSHLSEGMGAGVQGALEQLASAPVKEVAITELDIANAPADDFTAVVQACLNVEKCTSITIWGVSDADSWRQGENPLLFDSGFAPKDAYNAIIQLLGA